LRVFPENRLLPRENVVRLRRRMRWMQGRYARGAMQGPEIYRRLMSWQGHARQADSLQLRMRVFDQAVFQRREAGVQA
jgi:hypothetical protein